MRLSAFWRRSSSTAAGVYLSALIGFLGSIVAFRELGRADFGRLALVLAATGFFQLFADLTVEEAVIKYGFRYAAREDWGRFRRVFGLGLQLKLAGGALGAVGILVLAPLSHLIWNAHGLFWPMLLAALLPPVQAPEGLASAALLVRRRYDVRAAFAAGSAFSPYAIRISVGISHRSGGSSTAISSTAPPTYRRSIRVTVSHRPRSNACVCSLSRTIRTGELSEANADSGTCATRK